MTETHRDLVSYTPAQRAFADSMIEAMKADILAMFDEHRMLPGEVQSFADLHTYCDANCLGGMCDDSEGETLKGLDLIASVFPNPVGSPDYGTMNSQCGMDACNDMQDAVDAWIKTRPLWEGFDDEGTEYHIINPTCAEGGFTSAVPSSYGFAIHHTGGGCMAWRRVLPDGTECLITNEAMSTDLVDGEPFLLGIYNAETGEELALYEGTVGDLSPLRRAAS